MSEAERQPSGERAAQAAGRSRLSQETVRNRLLGVMLALLAVAGLKWSYPVTMPLAAAGFVIAVVWPVKPWLDRRVPSAISYLATLLLLFAVSAGFLAALYFSVEQVVQTFQRQSDAIRELIDRYIAWAEARDLPTFDGERGFARLMSGFRWLARETYAVLGYLGLISVLVILGLPEISGFRDRLAARFERDRGRVHFETLDQIVSRFRQYMGITLVTSLLTGLGTGAFLYAMGLELAVVWGVLNFLLNFIPVVGNVIGIGPPTLYALIQFDEWRWPLFICVGLLAIQIAISNFIYPALQGRGMAMPAVTIVIALLFWGWVWGFVGALLAVPLTAGFVIACGHFRSTEWIASLLMRGD